MNEFIKKISTYDLFVNFIPGCIFVWYLQECKGIELASASDMFTIPTIIVLCYAIGLINNRLGSLVIRPLCERTGIVKFATYETYMKAEKKDDKIKLLSELNNLGSVNFLVGFNTSQILPLGYSSAHCGSCPAA